MAKRLLTKEQQEALRLNPNVLSCSEKYISFTDDFKQLAVQRYTAEGVSARSIFVDAGFSLDIIGKDVPDDAMSRWKENAKKGDITTKKGRKKRSFDPALMTDKERIAYLEAEVDYLKSLHAFFQSRQARK